MITPAASVVSFRALIILLCASAATLFVSFRSIDFPLSEVPWHNDSAHYTLTSRQLFAGHDPYLSEFGQAYEQAGFINSPTIARPTNPPALAFIYIPFALMPLPWGYLTWSVVQICALILALRSLNRSLQLRLSNRALTVVTIAAITMCPTVSHIQYGQTQLLILALVSYGAELALRFNFKSHAAWALWGVATSLKLFTWPLVGVAFLFGGWTAALVFLASSFVMQLPATLCTSLQLLSSFAHEALPYIGSIINGYNSNNGLTGALSNTLQLMRNSSDVSLPSVVGITIALLPLLAILLLNIFWRARIRSSNFLNLTALTLIASCLFSPSSWNHYLVLLIFALMCLLRLTHSGISRAINPVSLLICYCLVGLTQGRIVRLGPEWALATIWWGPLTFVYVALLLIVGMRATQIQRA